ncbi:hypothetical protein [Paenibacillus farraposensis]|uniref:hypothetical protein n=1 Tax=Paenibacillus farraposensis TaxID=2807095 RepID=UPI0036700F7E
MSLWYVADLAHCPFASQQFDGILKILSPSNYAEFTRVLTEEGCILKVIPEQCLIHMTPLTWGAAEADWLRVKVPDPS